MRASILIAHVRGEDAWEFIASPETPMHEQRAMFKEAKVEAKHPRWDRIELWERGGSVDFVKLAPVDEVAEPAPAPQPPVVPAGADVPPGTVVTEIVTPVVEVAPVPPAPEALVGPAGEDGAIGPIGDIGPIGPPGYSEVKDAADDFAATPKPKNTGPKKGK